MLINTAIEFVFLLNRCVTKHSYDESINGGENVILIQYVFERISAYWHRKTHTRFHKLGFTPANPKKKGTIHKVLSQITCHF